MPTTTPSRVRDSLTRPRYVTNPLPHDEAARRARAYADRAVRATLKREGKNGATRRTWIAIYCQRYRYLTGKPRVAGPVNMLRRGTGGAR